MNKLSNQDFAHHTHILLPEQYNSVSPKKNDVGYAYTWENGVIMIKITSDIKCGDIIILKELAG